MHRVAEKGDHLQPSRTNLLGLQMSSDSSALGRVPSEPCTLVGRMPPYPSALGRVPSEPCTLVGRMPPDLGRVPSEPCTLVGRMPSDPYDPCSLGGAMKAASITKVEDELCTTVQSPSKARGKVLDEILGSEKVYVHHLRHIVEVSKRFVCNDL